MVTRTQISGSHSGVNEDSSVPECDVVSTGKYRFPRTAYTITQWVKSFHASTSSLSDRQIRCGCFMTVVRLHGTDDCSEQVTSSHQCCCTTPLNCLLKFLKCCWLCAIHYVHQRTTQGYVGWASIRRSWKFLYFFLLLLLFFFISSSFFFFFLYRNTSSSVLACLTILFHSSLAIAILLQFQIFFLPRSSMTSPSHLKPAYQSSLLQVVSILLFFSPSSLYPFLSVAHSISFCSSSMLEYLLTHSIVQSPSWEANWFAASQEIPRISRNQKVHYRTHKRPTPVPVLGQPNPVHIPTSHLLEVHPNIIHPSTPRSPQWSLSLQFPHQDPIFH